MVEMGVRQQDGVGRGLTVEQTRDLGEHPAVANFRIAHSSQLIRIERISISVEERQSQVQDEPRMISGNFDAGTADSGRSSMNRDVDRQSILNGERAWIKNTPGEQRFRAFRRPVHPVKVGQQGLGSRLPHQPPTGCSRRSIPSAGPASLQEQVFTIPETTDRGGSVIEVAKIVGEQGVGLGPHVIVFISLSGPGRESESGGNHPQAR